MYMMNSVLFYNDEGKCMYELMEKRPKTTKAVFDRLHTHTFIFQQYNYNLITQT